MTPLEEQFLQAAKQADKGFIQTHLSNMSLYGKIAAFVLTPSVEISKLLYQSGINPMEYWKQSSEPEYTKQTALTMACERNYLEKAKWLLSICPEIIDLPSETIEIRSFPISLYYTPLEIAITRRHFHLIKLLKKPGTLYQKDAYKLVSQKLQPIIGELLSSENLSVQTRLELFGEAAKQGWTSYIKTYLEQGIDIDEPTSSGRTALMLAAQYGQNNCVATLLSCGADITKHDENNYTALLYAAIGGDVETIKHLLQAGSKIEDKTKYGMTPLMLAIRDENVDIVKLLLENRADVTTTNAWGQTALNIAQEHNNQDLINLLKSAGAKE